MTDTSNTEPVHPSKLILGDKVYSFLKFIALIVLPAAATLYFTLGNVWGWPNVEQVVGTLVAVDTFLGIVLGISSKAYYNSDARFSGAIDIFPNPDEGTTDMNIRVDPNNLVGSSEVALKVNVNAAP